MSELFVFVAASELTLLKFIAIKIDKAVKDASEVDQETAITPQADLVFYRRLLERRSREAKSTLSHICNRHTLIWPTATGDSAAQSKSSLAALRSEKDFRYLIEVIEGLCGICDRELSVLVNAAGIAEAKRGIEQGKTLFGFTWLASIFVPLSFTTSLFGMNVREFEKAELPIWVWVVVTIPIFLFSVVFLFWGRIRLKDLRDRLIRLVVI
ncbi:uncharacterized protein RSE6_07149 [Rhynchosporium secalis]|uniref:Uncharacterized protein n=1 Tax=Rhynchosporium secalis TaxID=38038 RepID=A0A1E1MCC9_RHYSE|nr:uncharacterized protein RSE6_07149 [Rhynchosporium secalis]